MHHLNQAFNQVLKTIMQTEFTVSYAEIETFCVNIFRTLFLQFSIVCRGYTLVDKKFSSAFL